MPGGRSALRHHGGVQHDVTTRPYLVVRLPDRAARDLIAMCEVLIQEGVQVIALPATAPDFAQLKSLFGTRVQVGAYAVGDLAQLDAAVAAGADIIGLTNVDPALIDAARASGRRWTLPSFTPLEIAWAASFAPDAVEVWPAGLLGRILPSQLRSRIPADVAIVAAGGLTVDLVAVWTKARVTGVVVDEDVIQAALVSNDLVELRRAIAEWAQVLRLPTQ